MVESPISEQSITSKHWCIYSGRNQCILQMIGEKSLDDLFQICDISFLITDLKWSVSMTLNPLVHAASLTVFSTSEWMLQKVKRPYKGTRMKEMKHKWIFSFCTMQFHTVCPNQPWLALPLIPMRRFCIHRTEFFRVINSAILHKDTFHDGCFFLTNIST